MNYSEAIYYFLLGICGGWILRWWYNRKIFVQSKKLIEQIKKDVNCLQIIANENKAALLEKVEAMKTLTNQTIN